MVRFADEAVITVSSGKGGDGCIAFRREKYVPRGGPAGGDGGRGGDVVFVVKNNLRTLSYLRFKQTFKAQNGEPGLGRNMHGRDGADVVIAIPPGTVISDAETGEVLMDFGQEKPKSLQGEISGPADATKWHDGDTWVFLRGGKGGLGNTHFKNSVNQTPRYASPGQPGMERRLKIELQLIADVGLVGFPNAGKSSLLDAYTNAHPKIAPYPFTTKIPNLGVMTIHDRDIVLADIPGIIEGAHNGAGLGLRFLKHISRTAVLAYVVDLSVPDWETQFSILRDELKDYSLPLVDKLHLVIATKTDLPEVQERLPAFQALLAGERICPVSVFAREGLEELGEALFGLVLEHERTLDHKIDRDIDHGAGHTINSADYENKADMLDNESSSIAEQGQGLDRDEDFFDTALGGFTAPKDEFEDETLTGRNRTEAKSNDVCDNGEKPK